MSIEEMSIAMNSINTTSEIGVAVLSKSLDTMNTTADGFIRILEASDMERSVNPSVGGNIDISV